MYNLGPTFQLDYDTLLSQSNAIQQGEKYRITILTERLIRFEYNENGIFNDAPTELVKNRRFPVPQYRINRVGNILNIDTKYLKIEYDMNKPFKKGLRVSLVNTDAWWHYGRKEAANYGTTGVSLDDDSERVKLIRGLYSPTGLATIDDSKSLIINQGGGLTKRPEEGKDIYLFGYRADFNLALKDYFELTGYPVLLPRYAFGTWYGKNTAFNDTAILNRVKQFADNHIPLSVILLNHDWHKMGEKYSKTGYSWNPQFFPNPEELIKKLHMKNIAIGLNINPKDGILVHEDLYSRAITYMASQKDKAIPFAIMDPKFMDVYFKLFIRPLEAVGVDFFWIDYYDKKNLTDLKILNHYHSLNAKKDENRGLLMTRNSTKAAHREGILYSGELLVSWRVLKQLPYFNSAASNGGLSYWSHDIGGTKLGTEDRELYIRFIQLGTFSPILRLYSDGGKYYKREPWNWDLKTFEIAKQYLQLRTRLIPYIYSESYKYHKYGIPMIQPLYYKQPDLYDQPLYRNQYNFGSELLVAPITIKKDVILDRVIHKFYLPAGTWYDFRSGKKFSGNKKYILFYKEEDYPVFARAGSIVPMAKYIATHPRHLPPVMEIQVFPGKSNNYELYEDDGITKEHEEGNYLITNIDYNYITSNYTLIIRPVSGTPEAGIRSRSYNIRFRNTKQTDDVEVYLNNEKTRFTTKVDGNDFIVKVNKVPAKDQLLIMCKGKDIEINAVKLINEDIESILKDIYIPTKIKEKLDNILFGELEPKKKRIAIRKLKNDGLDPRTIKIFLKLIEYVGTVGG